MKPNLYDLVSKYPLVSGLLSRSSKDEDESSNGDEDLSKCEKDTNFLSIPEEYSFSNVPDQVKRFTAIKDKFVKLYKVEPQFFARSPGRLDIMGGHVDYNI